MDRLTEKAVGTVVPHGMNFSHFKDKLKSGELALLTDSPAKPVMQRDGTGKTWRLTTEGQQALLPEAKNAFLSRANVSRGAAGRSAVSSSAAYAPSIDDIYVPEPVKPDTSDAPPKLKYEYCFEIACSDDTFKKSVGCAFQLAKTKQEAMIARWQKETTENGTKYIAHTAFDEPKKLVVKVADYSMGISLPDNVQVNPIGSGVVQEAFIPVVPSVQLGERLGLPTEGYYYHFHNNRLVQEYKLLGEGKWAFYATCSTHENLNEEQGYNRLQNAILVYWKLAGREVENQSLIYLEQQITREQLDNLNDDWISEHGIKLDTQELLAAPKQSVAERPAAKPEQSFEPETALPPLSPCIYNCAANTHYDYSELLISGTQFKAINSEKLFGKEVSVANLTTITTASKATDYGKAALFAIPANSATTNLGILSSSTSNTLGTWSISGEALAGFARMGGFLVAALWPSLPGDSTLTGNSDFATSDAKTMRVRFNMYQDENGKQQVVGIKTGEGSPYGGLVAKREAVQQGQNFVAQLDNGISITWTPDGSTDRLTPDTVLPENDQLDVHNIWVRPIEEHQQEIGTILYPEQDLAEYLVTFPADSGLPPLYLVFRKTARDEPGVVTGSGEDITGIWLEKASEGLGAPVPSQIADKLRGKEFSSFNAFRKTFWIEVSEDPILSSQFIPSNIKRMKDGKAPRARFKDTVGGRRSFELHHLKEIQHGGDVYNVDNLRVNTPKNHINIHKG
ncbi:S-type pyocin domain-containing protein [Vibrio zhanjiangensis]|nr:S-type pyocin domain-containing protein [Vibrio zhanjiangensis]